MTNPEIQLYNTLSRQIEPLKPLKKKRVGLYTCGPTVYNFAHIGNLRTYVFEDILKRVLTYNGYKVDHVMNITDVGHLTSDADQGEDKMEKGAAREGKTAWEIAEFYTKAFLNDLSELNIINPDKFPRATDHIKEQIALIKKLEKKGFTYKTADGIYFDTSRLPDYGKLANLKNQELRAGVRVDVGDKKNITDFALWKFSPPLEKRQMEWESPWGTGFPGWHIECSAMAVKYLGQPFDIHCGGIDHIPVHHTNEIAQSEAAAGKPLANMWMHGEFLIIAGDKMAKSGDNFITLETLKKRSISPLAYRYFLLQSHYRKQTTFSWEALQAAEAGLNHLYSVAHQLSSVIPTGATQERSGGISQSITTQFTSHINNDLDLPGALALVWQALKEKTITYQELLKFDTVFGLQIKDTVEKLEATSNIVAPENIQALVSARDAARASKNFAESDRLRTELENLGYEVMDTKNGTEVRKK